MFSLLPNVAVGAPCDPTALQPIALVVKAGDSVSKLASTYNVAPEAILKLNPQIRDQNLLVSGLKLSVPASCNDAPSAQPAQSPSPANSPERGTAAPTSQAEAAAPPQLASVPQPAVARSSAPEAQSVAEPPAVPHEVSSSSPTKAEPTASLRLGRQDAPATSFGRKGEPGTGVEGLLVSEAPKAVFVIVLAVVAMWLVRRHWGQRGGSRAQLSRLSIVESRKLGAHHALYVVSYGSRVLLIGAAQGSINLLADLAKPGAMAQAEKLMEDAPASFADQLSRAVDEGQAPQEFLQETSTKDLITRIRETTENLRDKTSRLRDYRLQVG